MFRAWNGVDRGALGNWRDGRNDLEKPAIGLVPEIADVLGALSGAEVARMSGSGATCFALYASGAERDEVAASIMAGNPGWWAFPSCLR